MTLDKRNQEINEALEARFTQLNSAIEAHESKLKEMMVPKDAWVIYHAQKDEDLRTGEIDGEYHSCIGMIKLRGAWRLCHANHYLSYSGPVDDLDWKPLVEASIEDRIAAADQIDKLREAIVRTKEKLVPDIEKAIASLAHSLG